MRLSSNMTHFIAFNIFLYYQGDEFLDADIPTYIEALLFW